MCLLRRLFALALTLAVILSGAESAVARSEMAGASLVALCAGPGAAAPVVMLDRATGKPLAHAHACPHCLAAHGPWAGLPPPGLTPRLTLGRSLDRLALPPGPVPTAATPRAALARGPPLRV